MHNFDIQNFQIWNVNIFSNPFIQYLDFLGNLSDFSGNYSIFAGANPFFLETPRQPFNELKIFYLGSSCPILSLIFLRNIGCFRIYFSTFSKNIILTFLGLFFIYYPFPINQNKNPIQLSRPVSSLPLLMGPTIPNRPSTRLAKTNQNPLYVCLSSPLMLGVMLGWDPTGRKRPTGGPPLPPPLAVPPRLPELGFQGCRG